MLNNCFWIWGLTWNIVDKVSFHWRKLIFLPQHLFFFLLLLLIKKISRYRDTWTPRFDDWVWSYIRESRSLRPSLSGLGLFFCSLLLLFVLSFCLACTCSGLVHVVRVRTCTILVLSRRYCFLGVVLQLWLFDFFHSALLLHWSLSLEGRDLMKIYHVRLSAPRSLTFCSLSSCGSLC